LLNTYYSDNIEWLVELLAKKLQTNPPSVFEKIDISINRFLLGEWVKNQITLSNGIFAYCEIKSITDLTKNLVQEIKPSNKKDYWDLESLKWAIINSLEELIEFKEVWPIEFWVKQLKNNDEIIDKGLYFFSNNIAKIFSDYSIYRPELIYDWHNTNIHSKKLFKYLEKHEYWQALLFKLIQNNNNNNFLSFEILEIIQAIEKKAISIPNIQKYIHIITTDNISKLYIDFYQKISNFADINLYILSPGFDLWERTNSLIENNYKLNKKVKNKLIDPIREIKLGKSSANFQKLIDENSIANQVNINVDLLFSNHLNLYKNKKEIPLLKQIQNSIINKTDRAFTRTDKDSSLIFKKLPNIIKELEFIKLKILNLLKNESDIKLRDIAIITPNIDLIKKHLKFVFTNFKSTGIEIPFVISKTHYSEISNIYAYIDQIIEINLNKINNYNLKNLFNNKAILEVFNLEQDEINIFTDLLKESGFDWGLDKNDRMGEYRNSLDWCLEKIKLGLIYDENRYFKEYDLSPKSIEIDNIDLHKIIKLIELFIFHIKIFSETKNIDEWIISIEIILDDLSHRNYSYEINEFKNIINEYKYKYSCKKKIDILTFKECLESIFNKNYNFLNNRREEVIVSEMKTISFIPYKYIFICGMNDKYYPKTFIKNSYSIIDRIKIFGDPNQNDIERDLFLYFLISCKNKLCITYSEKDSEENKLNISSVVKGLKNFIESNSNSENIIEENINDNSEKSILINNDESFKKSYPLINNLEWKYIKDNDSTYKVFELQELLKEPQRYWLIRKNIKPPKRFKIFSKKEISPLKKINFLEQITNKIKIDNINFEEKILNLNLIEELISAGIIAPKNSIFDFEEDFKIILKSLIEIKNNFKIIKQISLKDKINRETFYISNKDVIELKHTKLSLNNIVDAWVRLLFINSQNEEIKSTKLIILKDSKYKIIDLLSPGKKEAQKILSTYSNIYYESKLKCLPIPPLSSFKFINTLKLNDYNKAIDVFRKTWTGSEFSTGEREKYEMKLCFGEFKEPEFFINNKSFNKLAKSLYQPLVNSLDREKNFIL
tara:strand:- start:89 stop:3277 length:3189 start_codon:yes stop_codon:yes gene_type:complete